jgi:hypothetical protein
MIVARQPLERLYPRGSCLLNQSERLPGIDWKDRTTPTGA